MLFGSHKKTPDALSKRDAERLLVREKSGNEKQLVIRLILQQGDRFQKCLCQNY